MKYEWQEWTGGVCPVEYGVPVDVKYRNGHIKIGAPALVKSPGYEVSEVYWLHHDMGADIVAWRHHKPGVSDETPTH